MFAICAFGDSIVHGRGDNLDRGWAGRLRKYFEAKDYYNVFYNLGIPGDTSTELLKRFQTECAARMQKKHESDRFVVLVGIGLNDSRYVDKIGNAQTEPELFRENVLRLVEIAKKYTAEIVFVGLTPVDEKLTNPYETTYFFNERVEEFNNIIRSCCADLDVLFVDLFNEMKKLDYPALLGDGVHPSPAGYEKMYDIIKEFLIGHDVID
jgi:lysophospholipase L1-like esterase